jgi:hypothetical protein
MNPQGFVKGDAMAHGTLLILRGIHFDPAQGLEGLRQKPKPRCADAIVIGN